MSRLQQVDHTKFLDCITCHSFNKDRSLVALCPNSADIEIWKTNGGTDATKWTKQCVLKEHSGLVSDLDWNHDTNQILSCAHDRDAYVWNLSNGEWKPTLCVLRINRAGISAKWSPSGKKFAVTSGNRSIPVCHYEGSSDWWVSRIIRKHRSTVVDCAWSPNSRLLLTACTDFKARIVSVHDDKLDQQDGFYDGLFGASQNNFGETLVEWEDTNGAWVNCVAWAPGGTRLAFFGHGSTAHFVDLTQGPTNVQTIYCEHLPMLQCVFIDDNTLVAAGFDNNPATYVCEGGQWRFKHFFEKESDSKAGGGAPAASATASAFARFQAADSQGQKFGDNAKKACFTTHKAQIDCIEWDGRVLSTSGVDGRVITWDMSRYR